MNRFLYLIAIVLVGCSVPEWLTDGSAESVGDGLTAVGTATGNPLLLIAGLITTLVASLGKNIKDGFKFRGVVRGIQTGLENITPEAKEMALKEFSKAIPKKYKPAIKAAKRILAKKDL